LLVLVLCGSVWAGDLVHLRNGRLLRGRVVSETRSTVVVDIGTGEVEVPRRLVRLIERGASERDVARQLTQRDEWFLVLHRERLVGWRRLIHTEGPERVHVEERTVFFRPGGGDDVDIRRVEVADLDGRPLEFLLSETYGKQTDMVSGQVLGDTAAVKVRRGTKVEARTIEVPADLRLPLPTWSRFLAYADPGESRTISVLDVRHLRTRRVTLTRGPDKSIGQRVCRTLKLGGETRQKRAFFVPGEGSLTIELNGTSLVAKRSTRARVELARKAHAAPEPLSYEEAIFYPFIQRPADLTAYQVLAGFSIKAPDAGWVPTQLDKEHGRVLGFEKVAIFGSLEVFVFPLPGGAGDADKCLANALARLRLTAKKLAPSTRPTRLRAGRLPARRVELRGRHRGEDLRCEATVVRAKDRYLLLVGASPERWWRWAKKDFAAFRDSLDVID
jgi:RNase P/RNase MRP subunit p29